MYFISVPFILNYSHFLITLISSFHQVEKSLAKTNVIDQTFNAYPQGKSFHSSYYNGLHHQICHNQILNTKIMFFCLYSRNQRTQDGKRGLFFYPARRTCSSRTSYQRILF